jgi:preprotein translocase subunit SecG
MEKQLVMLALLLLQLVLLQGAVGDQLEISLSGDSWSLSDTDGRVKAIKAQVPGVVHLDLM